MSAMTSPPSAPCLISAGRRRRWPLLRVDAKRLARMLCCGLRSVRTWDTAAELPASVKIGGRVSWSVEEVKQWIRAGCPERLTWEAIRKTQT